MEYVIIGIIVILAVVFYVRGDSDSSSTTVTKPVSKPAVRPVVNADANNNGITSKAELKKLTKVQLVDLAEKKSLKVKKSGTKAEIINSIHTQLK
jgi:hypothetical protein